MTDLVQTLVSGLSIGLVIGGLAVALAVGFQAPADLLKYDFAGALGHGPSR